MLKKVYDSYQKLLNGLDTMLQVCHGLPNQERTEIIKDEEDDLSVIETKIIIICLF